MVFGNGVKNIQAAAYNGTRTVSIAKSQTNTQHMELEPLCTVVVQELDIDSTS